jgi:hypothetical protein
MTREKEMKNMVEILSRGSGSEGDSVESIGGGKGGRGFRDRGGHERGRGRGMYRGRGRGRGRGWESRDDGYGAGLYLRGERRDNFSF